MTERELKALSIIVDEIVEAFTVAAEKMVKILNDFAVSVEEAHLALKEGEDD